MSYGAFVKLEEGIEGLVHISEMSWTKRISHPSELVQIDDEIEVVVLGINKEKQEISLGMKQTQENPWDTRRRPLSARQRRQGHGPQPDQLRRLHRDRGRHRRPAARQRHVVDPQDQPSQRDGREGPGGRVPRALGRSGAPPHRPGPEAADRRSLGAPTSPASTSPARSSRAPVTKITNFGVFVGLENGLEGLLHISELADHKVENPEEVVKVGEEIEVKILRVDADERKIGLSRKRVEWAEEDEAARRSIRRPRPRAAAASELKGGVGDARPADQAASSRTRARRRRRAGSDRAPGGDADQCDRVNQRVDAGHEPSRPGHRDATRPLVAPGCCPRTTSDNSTRPRGTMPAGSFFSLPSEPHVQSVARRRVVGNLQSPRRDRR